MNALLTIRIVDAYLNGFQTIRETASRCDVTTKTVMHHLKRAGVVSRSRWHYRKRHRVRRQCALCGKRTFNRVFCSIGCFRMARKGDGWWYDISKRAYYLATGGITYSAIGQTFGIATKHAKLRAQGFAVRNKLPPPPGCTIPKVDLPHGNSQAAGEFPGT